MMPAILEPSQDQELGAAVAQAEEEEEEEVLQASTQPEQPAPGAPATGPGDTQGQQAPTSAGGAGTGQGGGQGGGGGDGGDDDEGEEEDESQEQQGTGPVGSGDYVVRDGDCISSIAKQSGHFWETIWNDAGNSELKSVREDPNVLLPDDRVTIPELTPKQEGGATEEHHRFRRKGEPAMLRMRLVEPPEEEEAPQESAEESAGSDPDAVNSGDPQPEYPPEEDRPRADVPYVLDIDGVRQEGTTDADGRIEAPIPGNARRGKLILNPGTEEEETIELRLGAVGPITELSGVKQRLHNLTFDCGDVNEQETPELEAALRAFQQKHGLEVTGRADQATRDKLVEAHGC